MGLKLGSPFVSPNHSQKGNLKNKTTIVNLRRCLVLQEEAQAMSSRSRDSEQGIVAKAGSFWMGSERPVGMSRFCCLGSSNSA